jgi:hypothetical protein
MLPAWCGEPQEEVRAELPDGEDGGHLLRSWPRRIPAPPGPAVRLGSAAPAPTRSGGRRPRGETLAHGAPGVPPERGRADAETRRGNQGHGRAAGSRRPRSDTERGDEGHGRAPYGPLAHAPCSGAKVPRRRAGTGIDEGLPCRGIGEEVRPGAMASRYTALLWVLAKRERLVPRPRPAWHGCRLRTDPERRQVAWRGQGRHAARAPRCWWGKARRRASAMCCPSR